MGTIYPRPLRKGDRICVIDPANAFTEEGILGVQACFEEKGFEVVFSRDMAFRRGTPQERAELFNQVIRDEENRGIFCMWGGYGTMTLLDLLDYPALEANRPVFSGFSDNTALHLAIGRRTDLVTFHGPILYSAKRPATPEATEAFLKLAGEPEKPRTLVNLNGEEMEIFQEGICEGKLTGGNLTLISRLMGTPWEIDTKGKILFFEEVGERPYRLHGMLTQLAMAGKLQEAAGIVVGALTDCDTPGRPGSARQLVMEALEAAEGPVVYGLAAGHRGDTLTLSMNAPARLEAVDGEIHFQTGV